MAKDFGTVVRKVDERGFLFIEPENGENSVFAHYTGFLTDQEFAATNIGDRVSYTVIKSPKGMKAVNVLREQPSPRTGTSRETTERDRT